MTTLKETVRSQTKSAFNVDKRDLYKEIVKQTNMKYTVKMIITS
jgi:hypothetical protein